MRHLLACVMIVFAIGPVSAADTSSIVIELLPENSADTIFKRPHKVYFIVKVSNPSKGTLCFFQEWNGRGYRNIDFSVETPSGRNIRVKRIARGWESNDSSTFTLRPGQYTYIPIYDDGRLRYWENLAYLISTRRGVITARYRQPSDEGAGTRAETNAGGCPKALWMGSVYSKAVELGGLFK
jgi:hypothetical protein